MAREVDAYDEAQTIFEVLNDGIPEFYGTYEECVQYINEIRE